MHRTGRVKTWNAERGYGFVEPDDGGRDVFIHISALPDDLDGLEPGTSVRFEDGISPRDGKPCGTHVAVLSPLAS